MERMMLSDIRRYCGAECDDFADLPITGICTDSRTPEPGCLFIGLVGERFDGSDYAADAVRGGAAAVLCRRKVEGLGVSSLVVEDPLAALQRIAAGYRTKFQLPVVGVTGSVGKTTTKELIAGAISRKYSTLKTEGNFNNEIGLPKMIFRIGYETEAAVLEMGMSAFGEIETLSKIARPSVMVITNIGVSHIENLGSRENILKAKLEILRGAAPGAPLLINGDNDLLSGLTSAEGHPILSYGIDNLAADIRAEEIRQEGADTLFTVCSGTIRYENFRLPAQGKHNVLNALAAFGVARLMNVPVEQIREGIAEYSPVGMRQKWNTFRDATVIEDCYNASPESMHAAFDVIRGTERKGKTYLVLGDMLELGEYSSRMHYDVGLDAARLAPDGVWLFGKYAPDYLRGLKEGGSGAGIIAEGKIRAAEQIASLLAPGDILLVKGSRGMKLEELLGALYTR